MANHQPGSLQAPVAERPLRFRLEKGRQGMAIYRLLKFSVFEPEQITRMTAAYENALVALQLTDREDPITELVARKIIEVAQTGDLDPVHLCEKALGELQRP